MNDWHRIIEAYGKRYNGVGLAIGNFDGGHMGHRAMVETLGKLCKEKGLTPLGLTFYPHPQEVLTGNKMQYLASLPDRLLKLYRFGLEDVMVLPFSESLARVSYQAFILELEKTLGLRALVMGESTHLGANRQGTPQLIEKLCRTHHIDVSIQKLVNLKDQEVSSTAIKQWLKKGSLEKVRAGLGEYPYIKGQVISGDGRGRKLGFPTANIALREEYLVPPDGVYACVVKIDLSYYWGVCHLGGLPSFGRSELRCEVHILDHQMNIYDREMKIAWVKKLRDIKKFSGANALIAAIQEDIRKARTVLGPIQMPRAQRIPGRN